MEGVILGGESVGGAFVRLVPLDFSRDLTQNDQDVIYDLYTVVCSNKCSLVALRALNE